MIDEKVKTKNALMERLYELLAENLEGIPDYQASEQYLLSIFRKFTTPDNSISIKTNKTDEGINFLFLIGKCEFNLIALYQGSDGAAFFNISPPHNNETIDQQISLSKSLISHLTDSPLVQ